MQIGPDVEAMKENRREAEVEHQDHALVLSLAGLEGKRIHSGRSVSGSCIALNIDLKL